MGNYQPVSLFRQSIIKFREGDGLNASDAKDEQALRWIGSTMQELEMVG